eukprot:6759713-Prymnesium_polylepis.1
MGAAPLAADADGAAELVPPLPKLTKRERTVLELVGEGKLNKEIAASLGVSRSHVEKYVKRLFDKTATTNRTELVRRAARGGVRRAACGMRGVTCCVRRAACGVRRAACG